MPRSSGARWEERNLIPYEASTFTARRAVVLAPHPDDEVFGCGAAIASLRAQGADVRVVLVSDGAGDEPDPGRRAEIAAARAAESRAALVHLGGADVVALGFPDRGLGARLDALASAFAREIEGRELVFVPSPSEIHPDHRAVFAAFEKLVPRLPDDLTVALFEVSQPIRPNFLLDATPHAAAKDRAMEAFASQIGGRDYPAFVRGLNAYRRLTLPKEVAAAEGYFVATVKELRANGVPTWSAPSRGLLARLLS